jgi:hypothetical protein
MSEFHRERMRAAKASAIALQLIEGGFDEPETVAYMDEAERASWAEKAGQKVPSDDTWGAVVGVLEYRKAHPQPTDPFDGLLPR